MKYQLKQPEQVEALTFDELVEYGKANGANIVNGMPWSFTYKGRAVTHENDRCYIISQDDAVGFVRPGDMLVVSADNEMAILPSSEFEELYEPAP